MSRAKRALVIHDTRPTGDSVLGEIEAALVAQALRPARIEVDFNAPHSVVVAEVGRKLADEPPALLRDTAAIVVLSGTFRPFAEWPGFETGVSAATAIALLALSYPELRLLVVGTDSDPAQTPPEEWFATSVSGPQRVREMITRPALFDASGIRRFFLARLRETASGHFQKLPLRDKLACAMDEEPEYAYFHAYLGFRCGMRAEVLQTRAAVKRCFGRAAIDGGQPADTRVFEVVFEDIDVEFDDSEPGERLSDLNVRHRVLNRLLDPTRVRRRVIITAGNSALVDSTAVVAPMEEAKKHGVEVDPPLFKPSNGLFGLMRQSKLEGMLAAWSSAVSASLNPEPISRGPIAASPRRPHSAPGMALVVVRNLIERARRLLHEGRDVIDFVHGSVLALEAVELLRYRTATTSLEAIALRHSVEVRAECAFYGIGYKIEVRRRLHELDIEVDRVGGSFAEKDNARVGAKAEIVTALARVFREFGRFDEEQQCLKRLRALHLDSMRMRFANSPLGRRVRGRRVRLALHYLLTRPVWYLFKLVGSGRGFLLMLALWPTTAGLLAAAFRIDLGQGVTFWDSIYGASIAFFSMQPAGSDLSLAAEGLTLALIIVGVFHLGVFISHLYTLIMRR